MSALHLQKGGRGRCTFTEGEVRAHCTLTRGRVGTLHLQIREKTDSQTLAPDVKEKGGIWGTVCFRQIL